MEEPQRPRPYRQVARAKAQEQTRNALLDAADEEMAYSGSRFSLQTIAQRAGVTKQTALRHFGSKEGMIEAALRRTSEIVRRERARSPIGDVRGAVDNLVDHYERWGNLVLRVLAEEHRASFMRKATDRGRDVHIDWVMRTFEPQLSNLDDDERRRRFAALVAICDIHMWSLLRHNMKLSVSDTKLALEEILEGLVGSDRKAWSDPAPPRM